MSVIVINAAPQGRAGRLRESAGFIRPTALSSPSARGRQGLLVSRGLLLGNGQDVIIGDVGDRHGDFRRGELHEFLAEDDPVDGFLDLLSAGEEPIGVTDFYAWQFHGACFSRLLAKVVELIGSHMKIFS